MVVPFRVYLVAGLRSFVLPRWASLVYGSSRHTANMCGKELLSMPSIRLLHTAYASNRYIPTCVSNDRACWRSCAHPPPVEDIVVKLEDNRA